MYMVIYKPIQMYYAVSNVVQQEGHVEFNLQSEVPHIFWVLLYNRPCFKETSLKISNFQGESSKNRLFLSSQTSPLFATHPCHFIYVGSPLQSIWKCRTCEAKCICVMINITDNNINTYKLECRTMPNQQKLNT